jgi:O-antigen/teichoic acid export membrane protein
MIRRLLGPETLRQRVVVLLFGTALGQALPMLASPLLTRLFDPHEFGVLGVFSAACMSLIPLATMRYECVLLIARSAEDVADTLVLTGLTILAMSLFALCIVAALPFEGLFDLPGLAHVKFFLPLALFCVSMYQLLVYEATRVGNFTPVARTKLLQGVVGPSSQILLGLTGFGPVGLVIGFILSQAAGAASLYRRFIVPHFPAIRASNLTRVRRLARTHVSFPLFSSWSGVLQEAGNNYLIIILIIAFYDPTVAGFLFLSDRIVGRPLLIVTTSLLQVAAGDLSKRLREDPGTVRVRFLKIVGVQFVLSTLWCGFVASVIPLIVAPVFGADWVGAVPFIQTICVAYVFQATMHPVSPTLQLMERQGALAAWEIVRAVAIIGGVAWAAQTGRDPLFAVALYAGIQAGMQILLFFGQIYQISKLKTDPSDEAKNSARALEIATD